jgi:DNA-binding CsgD family transcriptional regulator
MLDLYPEHDRLRATGLAQSAWVAVCQGSDDATDLLEQARAAAGHDEHPHVAYAEAAYATFGLGDSASPEVAARARHLLRKHGGADGDVGMATMWWAVSEALFGDLEASDRASQTHLEEARRIAAPWHLSWAQWVRAVHLLRDGALDEAGALLHRSLSAQRRIGDYWGPIWWVAFAAWLASARGEHLRAAELSGATERVMELTGIQLTNLRGNGDQHMRCQELARAALGEPVYQAAYRRGRAVPDYATAITLALGEVTLGEGAPSGSGAGRRLLTRREQEVALLVAERTNDEIAAALGVSVATVKTHVTQILQKLGCASRRQVPDALARVGLE